MRNRSKLLLVGLATAAVLAAAVGSASANRLSVSEPRYRIVWNPLTLEAAGAQVKCVVTLEGSFHSATVRKVANALVGYVTRATLNNCTEGSATILQATLPWHVRYESFSGTLPNITGVNLLLIGASFRADPPGIAPACLARTTEANPARGIVNINASHVVTGLTADPIPGIPLSEGFGCGIAEGHFIGTGAVTRLGTTGSLTVTLI
jgi:hypothetical protein